MTQRRTTREERPREDLPLAPLHDFNAAALLTADERDLAAFMLMAALAFNDLKDLAAAEGALIASPAAGDDPEGKTPRRGEYAGQRVHVHRVLVGLLNEVMQLIADHTSLFPSRTFERCLKRMPVFAVRAWDALLDASQGYASGGKGDRKLRTALVTIRANVGFHYHQPKGLASGMAAFGASAGARAYVSLGRNAQASRFYFADAAAQTYFNSTLQGGLITLEDVMTYAGHVLDALRLLVGAYLQERKLVPTTPPRTRTRRGP